MKRFLVIMFLIYTPCLQAMLKLVQPETLEALELYENLEPEIVEEQNAGQAEQEGLEQLQNDVHENHSIVDFENDPEQHFVDKQEVQERINQHEILEFTLDEVLDRAREYPGYYGDSDKEEITAWYEQAQQNLGYQKEILDRIKEDAKKYSLEKILQQAQKNPGYKGAISYQKIVDTYYQIHPQKIIYAEKQFYKAIQFLHIDEDDNSDKYEKDLELFLKEYRKLPTSLQQTIIVKTLHGNPYLGGAYMKSAKTIVDWIVAHQSEYLDLQKELSLLQF